MERAYLLNQGRTTGICFLETDLYLNVVAALAKTIDVNYKRCFWYFL